MHIDADIDIDTGTMVTISRQQQATPPGKTNRLAQPASPPLLTDRQKQILLLRADHESVDSTLVSEQLGISLVTAHRDLAYLQTYDMVRKVSVRKKPSPIPEFAA